MAILPITEKQGELAQLGGWQKEMARRRYQKGSIRKRGKRNPVWELQWWMDRINTDGTLGRNRESVILGPVRSMTLRQARKASEEHLRPLNLGKVTPYSAITIREFVEKYFVPNFFPTLKPSTRQRYRCTLDKHLLPAFGDSRLCDIGTLELQQFVLQKMASGLGWECADHYRNLMSKIFVTAKKWGFFAGDNPAIGVELPEKKAVREKHVLLPEQIPPLLAILGEPVNTMVLLGVLTGLRIGETSVVTPKPANGGQGKTGQREEAGDSVVLSCRLLWWQVYFRTPTPRTTFEYMTMMEKTIEHGGDGGAISQ